MTTVNVYLTFKDNCMEVFEFYKSVFGGEFTYVGKFGDMPSQEGIPPVPESEKDKIMHISLPISNETMLMGSDSSDAFGHVTLMGNNFAVSINTDSKEEADRLFHGLSDGGKVTMPMNQTFWGAYFGMFTDKFNINWMISVESNEQN
ncbi:MAG: VOC family protein [Ignavibacteria bacterium]|nr:VOC family protein [Ignavibacteria bacterium]